MYNVTFIYMISNWPLILDNQFGDSYLGKIVPALNTPSSPVVLYLVETLLERFPSSVLECLFLLSWQSTAQQLYLRLKAAERLQKRDCLLPSPPPSCARHLTHLLIVWLFWIKWFLATNTWLTFSSCDFSESSDSWPRNKIPSYSPTDSDENWWQRSGPAPSRHERRTKLGV